MMENRDVAVAARGSSPKANLNSGTMTVPPPMPSMPDKMALQRLKEAAEKAKMELSNTTQANINLPFITAVDGQPVHLDYTLTRAEFERITRNLLERCKAPVSRALTDAGLGAPGPRLYRPRQGIEV